MKKSLLAFATALMVSAISLTACGETTKTPTQGGEVDEVINLKYWNGFTGKDGDAMRSIVNEFNAQYKGKIKVKVDQVVWDNLFLKLIQNKGDVATSPNIIAIPANRITLVKKNGIIRELNDIIEYTGAKQEEYLEGAWNIGVFGDTRWTFPLDMHPTAMFYNKDLISEDKIPTTWDEFITVCKELTTKKVSGWAIPSMYSITLDIYLNMLAQEGLDIFEVKNGEYVPVFNSQRHIEILERLRTWKYVDQISPNSVGAAGDLTLFNNSKSVFYFDGCYEINGLKEVCPINWGVAPLPDYKKGGYSGSHQLALVDATTADAKIKDACYTFINFLTKNPLNWAKGGQVPAYTPIHENEEYKAMTELQPFTKEAEIFQMGTMQYDEYYTAYNMVGSAVANVLGNNVDAKTSLESYYKQFQQYLIENA